MRPEPQFVDSPWTGRLADLAAGRKSDWALMERFEVPDLDRPERTYLARLRIVQTPWFGLYLHRFDTPDSRPTFHDHPWPFVSLILRGGYIEQRPQQRRTVRRLNVMRRGDVHYIDELLRVPTWSLLLVGKRGRKWGYVEPDGDGYRWTAFDRHWYAHEFDAAMARRAEHKAEEA